MSLAALLLAAYVFPGWPVSDGDLARIRGGEALHRDFEDGDLRGSMLRFFVRSDAPTCYRHLADVPAMPKYMPQMRSIRVVAERPGVKILEYRSQHPLIPDFTLARHFEPPNRIWWTKVKAPYKRIEGSWEIAPAGPGSLLTYSLAVETGMLVPSWLALEFQKQGSDLLIRNVTRRIESGGRWVRPDYPEDQTPN